MVLLRLENPVEVAVAMLDVRRQVNSDKDVDGQALAGFLNEWDFELSEDLASGTVAAEQVLGPDLVRVAGEVVSDGAGDHAGLVSREGEEGSVETVRPAKELSASYDDRFEDWMMSAIG